MKLTDQEYLNLYYKRCKLLGKGSYATVFALNETTAIKVNSDALDFRLSDIEENEEVFFDSFIDGRFEVNVEFDSQNIDRLLNLNPHHRNLIFPKEKVYYKGKFIAYTMDYIAGTKTVFELSEENVLEYYDILLNHDIIRKIDNLVRLELGQNNLYIMDIRLRNILYKDGEIFLIDHDLTQTGADIARFRDRYNTFLLSLLITPILETEYCVEFEEKLLTLNINDNFRKLIQKIYVQEYSTRKYNFHEINTLDYYQNIYFTEFFHDDVYKILEMISGITKLKKHVKKIQNQIR